jgi:hypothetical protein
MIDEIRKNSTSADRPRCYRDIKNLARKTGLNVPDLLALSANNDPLYIMPAQAKQGEWFAELWNRFGFPAGVHLRRIHYVLASQPEPIATIDGRLYENTEKCWQYLGMASKAARCLYLIPADELKDARNPAPKLHRSYPPRQRLAMSLYGDWHEPMVWELPTINADLVADLDWRIPGIHVEGYEVGDHDQPFHLELIAEKSTMDDLIIPLCGGLGVNYAPATGFQSMTGSIELLKRLRKADKPGVVFYVSDFDPAGAHMPTSVARQLEYWLPIYAPGLDVVLQPVVLMPAQVEHYRLPPIPIKETDKRQDNFKDRYGVAGATELDALEALHPGELARIIGNAIARYRDDDARLAVPRLSWQASKLASTRWRALIRPYRWRLEQLKDEAAGIVAGYEAQLEALRDAMADELEPLRERLKSLRQAVKAEFAEFDADFDLPARYESPLALPDQFDGLFDSRRKYLDQLARYKISGKVDLLSDLEAHS